VAVSAHGVRRAGRRQPDAVLDAEHGDDDLHDVTTVEWLAWTPLLVLILLFGVYPQALFEVFDPAVTAMVDRLKDAF
jgi:NADH-quinone oxidoreductase subunit M